MTDPLVILYEDDDDDEEEEESFVHGDGGSFCADPTCPCHEDDTLIEEVAEDVDNDLLDPDLASDIVSGRYHRT